VDLSSTQAAQSLYCVRHGIGSGVDQHAGYVDLVDQALTSLGF
jgi:hypothetical protein